MLLFSTIWNIRQPTKLTRKDGLSVTEFVGATSPNKKSCQAPKSRKPTPVLQILLA